jgi:HEAT repeat protein
VPALIRAATAGSEPDEKYVRFAAIKGLAVFAGNLKPGDSTLRAEIEPVMLKASSDDEPLMRSTAAFALGALGGEKAITRLKQMLVDANPNVRFNAATMLASDGSLDAEPVLLEMLDTKSTSGLEIEDEKELREQKQETILISALRAVKKLADANPKADLGKLKEAVTAISSSKLAPRVRSEALAVLKDLEQRSPASVGDK